MNSVELIRVSQTIHVAHGKARRRERRNVQPGRLSQDQVGHDLRRYRRQQDAVAEMSSGDEAAASLSRAGAKAKARARSKDRSNDGQVIRTSGPQPGPAFHDRRRSELGHQGCGRAMQVVDSARLYCLVKAHVFYRRAHQNLSRTARHHVDIEGVDDVFEQTGVLWLKVEKLALTRLYRRPGPGSAAIDHYRRGNPAGAGYDFNVVAPASGTYRLNICVTAQLDPGLCRREQCSLHQQRGIYAVVLYEKRLAVPGLERRLHPLDLCGRQPPVFSWCVRALGKGTFGKSDCAAAAKVDLRLRQAFQSLDVSRIERRA